MAMLQLMFVFELSFQIMNVNDLLIFEVIGTFHESALIDLY
jgi:hypothetical protein